MDIPGQETDDPDKIRPPQRGNDEERRKRQGRNIFIFKHILTIIIVILFVFTIYDKRRRECVLSGLLPNDFNNI